MFAREDQIFDFQLNQEMFESLKKNIFKKYLFKNIFNICISKYLKTSKKKY